MQKFNRKDIVGLYFTNGIQGIVTIKDEDEHFIYGEKFLGIQLQQGPDGNPQVFLEDLTPFATIHDEGLDVRIPQSSLLTTFEVQEQLIAGYKKRTGQNIQIASASLADTVKVKR